MMHLRLPLRVDQRRSTDVSERSAGGPADALSHLLQLAMLEKSGRPTDTTNRELLRDRIKQYVQTHLLDPAYLFVFVA